MQRIRYIIVVSVLLIASLQIQAQVAKGNGVLKVDIRDLSGFTEVIAQGSFDLYLIQGQEEAVRIETDENLVDFFQTRIEGEVLYIEMTADIRKYKEINVYVALKELKSVTLLNEIYLKSENVIQFDELSLYSSGMSRIDLELFASKLDAEFTDGTYAYLRGYTEYLNMEIHDETDLNAFDLQADYCNIKSSGLTEVMINVEKDLKLMVTGGSNVYYLGDPKISQRVFSSTGFIVKRKKKFSDEELPQNQ